jgi:hypothetical protein
MEPRIVELVESARGHLGTMEKLRLQGLEEQFQAGKDLLEIDRKKYGGLTQAVFFREYLPEYPPTTLRACMKMVNDCGTIEEANKRGRTMHHINHWLVKEEAKAAGKVLLQQEAKAHKVAKRKGEQPPPLKTPEDELKFLDRQATAFTERGDLIKIKLLARNDKAALRSLDNTLARVERFTRRARKEVALSLHEKLQTTE